MAAMERYGGGQLAERPEHARLIGRRVKPIIRLGMGVKIEGKRRDNSTYTRPEKTDYLTVRGDERAVKKFKEIYGEKPKAIDIMVPSALELALDISYRAFIGGQDDGDGRPLALGMTNFALLGYAGGPDVLRVWKQDGTYVEVETEGLDELGKPLDEIANDLKIELHTTFTFTIPDVLGWGSFAQITSKGKKTADNLTFKLTEIYSAFGAKAPFAFSREERPKLVLKPDTALMRFEDKTTNTAKWGKTKIFVLDIVIPESFDDMRDRLVAHSNEIEQRGGPASVMYGHERPALEPAPLSPEPVQAPEAAAHKETPTESPAAKEDGAALETKTGDEPSVAAPPEAEPEEALEGEVEQPFAEPEPTLEDEPIEEGEFTAPASVEADPAIARAKEAAKVHPPDGNFQGYSLEKLLEEKGDRAVSWFKWALRNWEDLPKKPPFKEHLWAFCRVYLPELVEQVESELAAAA